ncbi:nuclear transport factor 2 family protein [Dactylosporangium sp. CS-033363]|uniref:nuclear transport factor 2 family protein n=1 Tax=Dactylosporangium sp. CS-033363 TaxID=3239935 RepID=UPI003D948599
MSLVERFLAAVVSPDPGDLADCYAAQVVIEMPFAVPGLMPSRLETSREELRARFRAGTAVRRYTEVLNPRIHECADGTTVVLEYDVRGLMLATEEPFVLRFVMVMTLADGLIAHTRDYTDPIAGARALGRLPDLLAAVR